MRRKKYPYNEGDVIVLGPEVFADKDGAVISWKGENYIAARWRANAQEAIRRALDELGVPGPDYPANVANAVEILSLLLPDPERER